MKRMRAASMGKEGWVLALMGVVDGMVGWDERYAASWWEKEESITLPVRVEPRMQPAPVGVGC